MSDWAIGDLAVCVDDGPCHCGVCPGNPIPGLKVGRAYAVLGVHVYRDREPGLVLDKTPSNDGIHAKGSRSASARRFRKVTPDKREACEEEFVTLLRRSKPKVRA